MYGIMLEKARAAARAAAEVLSGYYGGDFRIRKKGVIDLVTDADLAAERSVLDVLGQAFPDHGFLLEENTRQPEEKEYTWVVDPLDGTTNFAHGYPFFCVSVALLHQGRPVVGVVNAPAMGEEFWACRGGGAFRNGEPVAVSETADLMDAMLVTGFPYDAAVRRSGTVALFERFLERCQAVRRDGSAALDLCYVAMGRFDGFWERNLNPWDTAAGLVLVEEAGGRVTRFDGSPFSPFHKEILASNTRLHPSMQAVLKEAEAH